MLGFRDIMVSKNRHIVPIAELTVSWGREVLTNKQPPNKYASEDKRKEGKRNVAIITCNNRSGPRLELGEKWSGQTFPEDEWSYLSKVRIPSLRG